MKVKLQKSGTWLQKHHQQIYYEICTYLTHKKYSQERGSAFLTTQTAVVCVALSSTVVKTGSSSQNQHFVCGRIQNITSWYIYTTNTKYTKYSKYNKYSKYSQAAAKNMANSCCQCRDIFTLLAVRYKISYQKYNKYSKYIRMLPETWLSFSHDCQCRALFKCGQNQHFVCGQVQNITPRNTTNTANT